MFNSYGQLEGESQIAPGRDVQPIHAQRRNGRPPQANINTAITGGMPVGQTPFQGAQQTVGAQAPGMQPSAIDRLGTNLALPQVQGPDGQSPSQTFNQGASAPAAGGGDHRSTVMNILSKYGYGHQALAAAEQELAAAGFQLQKNTPGQARGRIKTPDGRLIDIHDPREGRTDAHNWFNSPVQDGQWAWNDMGHESQADAGGWSFTGPGGPSPNFAQAITGGGGGDNTPTAGMGDTYAARIRQQVMDALQKQPGLAELGKMFGV